MPHTGSDAAKLNHSTALVRGVSDAGRSSVPLATRLYLSLEFILLFGGVPMLIYHRVLWVRALIPTLLVCFLLSLFLLLIDRSFDRGALWRTRQIARRWRTMLLLFVLGAAMLTIYTLIVEPGRLLSFPRHNLRMWAIVMVFYPLVSVYPQEFIYRTFLFHRYRALFPARWAIIGVSAIAFGYMHIVFENALAVGLTTIGGLLFAITYDRTRSTAAASLEHALFGCFIFTIGLGYYFYGGNVNP